MPAKGDPQLVDALCIMTPLLAGLCCRMKAPQSASPEKPEVPTTSEPSKVFYSRVDGQSTLWTHSLIVKECQHSLVVTL